MIYPACRQGSRSAPLRSSGGFPEIALYRRDRQGISAGFYITWQRKASQMREKSRSSQPCPVFGTYKNVRIKSEIQDPPYSIPEACFSTVFTPQAMRGVLCAMTNLPSASSKMIPPCPLTRSSSWVIASLATHSGMLPDATRSADHLAKTSFIIGSPQPVVDAAPLWLSA